MTSYRTLNPSTGELLRTFPLAEASAIERAVVSAATAFSHWKTSTHQERRKLLSAVANGLESRSDELARTVSLEMGKVFEEAKQELSRCARVCRYFADNGEALLADEERDVSGEGRALTAFDPLGPMLAIMPWNFPLWQVFRCAAPALAAGNTILLKHAPNTPQCAEAITALFSEAGAPSGLFQNLFLSNEQAASVLQDRRVACASLTGSVRAGKSIAGTAGAHLKKVVLELGGSDPFIICEDADGDRAVKAALSFRLMNNGQSCISPKRILVQRRRFGEIRDKVVQGFRARRIGDPFDPTTESGPMAREDLRDALLDQVRRSVAQGARLVCGAEVPSRPGFFVSPGVLENPPPGSAARCEELFGPIAVLVPFDSEEEAARIANETAFGLGASIWTADEARGFAIARGIDAGCVFINGGVRSEPSLPFGGIKDSGLGRELGREGIREFTNIKTVRIFP
jgi:succinate-semialdehyde dehydrogenase/glutarate-semialdehyde dehydrogenase